MRKKTIILQSRVLLIVLVVMASFLAAFIGQLLLDGYGNQSGLAPQNFVIRQSSDRLVLMKEAAEKIEERESAGFVELYQLQQGRLEKIGEGVVLTNDGWVAAVRSVNDVSATHVRLNSGRLIEITQQAVDPTTGLYFAQVDSEILTPVTLANNFSAETLDPLLVADYRGSIEQPLYLGDRILQEGYLSADQRNRYPVTHYPVSGGRVYNEKAELAGLVHASQSSDGLDRIIPVESLRSAFDTLLRSGEFKRPLLRLSYIDLANSVVERQLHNLPTSGAWITNVYPSESRTLVDLTGPLFQAGLVLDDVVSSVNGVVLNHSVTLSDALLGVNPGDRVELGVLRKGEPISIQFVFPELVK